MAKVPIMRSLMALSFGMSTTSGTGGHTNMSRATSTSKNFISDSLSLIEMSKYLGVVDG
jgi:hypothetical protein